VLTRRIVACLDVRAGRVVKGVRFRDHVDAGGIEELAARYAGEGADELVFYDIGASPEGRAVELAWVARVSRLLDIPFCVAGGISSVEQARRVLGEGADKVSVNSPALRRPALVAELAEAFGSQCVVVGIDSERDADGDWRVRRDSGDPARMQALPLRTLDWIGQAQALGAGEIVLNCIGADGVRAGYDLPQLQAARAVCAVPLVASGGAGSAAHFAAAFAQADVDAALAASVFHSGQLPIPALKRQLRDLGLAVRT
jgi:cyclase